MRIVKFTYHIVNIKLFIFIYIPTFYTKFTYHIVNIKLSAENTRVSNENTIYIPHS